MYIYWLEVSGLFLKLMKSVEKPVADYTHVAFNVLSTDYLKLNEKFKNAGIETLKDNTSEGESFYFLDPDAHKLELIILKYHL